MQPSSGWGTLPAPPVLRRKEEFQLQPSSGRSASPAPSGIERKEEAAVLRKAQPSTSDINHTNSSPGVLGRRLEVFWPDCSAWYLGSVRSFDIESHKYTVAYDDGDEEQLDLTVSIATLFQRCLQEQSGAKSSKGQAARVVAGGSLDAMEAMVGRRIEVLWPADSAWYLGKVASYNAQSGRHLVRYNDGDEERLDLSLEVFRLVDGKLCPPKIAAGNSQEQGCAWASTRGDMGVGRKRVRNQDPSNWRAVRWIGSDDAITWLAC